jgi:curli biogenesis system outer membrane secretion channel CsgG
MRRLVYLCLAMAFILCGYVTPAEARRKKKTEKVEEISLDIPKAEGNLRYSITVQEFENKAGWSGQWNLGNAFQELTTHALYESGWFIVLGDKEMRSAAMGEQDFAASGRAAGGKKAPKMGRMTPAQLLLKGAITHVQSDTGSNKGGIGFKGFRVGGSKGSAEINLMIYLVDSETGQVKASKKVVGKSAKRGLSVGYYGSKLGGLTGGMESFKKDNVGKATEHAIAQCVAYCCKQLDDISWEGSVILAKGNRIILNRGSREGVAVGAKFNVGAVEQLIDEDTGEVLDEEMTTVGTVEVTKVKEKIAYCKPVGAVKGIKKGMSVHPAE